MPDRQQAPPATPSDVVESYLLGVVSDPDLRQASFTFRTPRGDREFRLMAYEVQRISMNEFSQQNIVHAVEVLGDARDPGRVRDLLSILLFDKSASDIDEPAFRDQLDKAATEVLEGRKVLLEIEPVCGAAVILLAGSIEWVLPGRGADDPGVMKGSIAEVTAALILLEGRPCWSVLAGAGTGPTMHLEFGAKIPRRVPLRDRPQITREQARYEGQLDLLIQCAWRLELGDTVLCGSTDDDRNDGAMKIGLRGLEGKTVLALSVEYPVPDLSISFEGDLRLRVFCDQTNIETNDDNYSVRVGDTIHVVGARGRIGLEQRGGD